MGMGVGGGGDEHLGLQLRETVPRAPLKAEITNCVTYSQIYLPTVLHTNCGAHI